MSTDATIERISAAAEHRGGRAARRADGAYFTSNDVAAWLARRAIGARILTGLGLEGAVVDELLARGADMRAELRSCITTDVSCASTVRSILIRLRVLDPSCGAGVFLAAALDELRAVQALLDEFDTTGSAARVSATQLTGVDVAAAACDAAREILSLLAGEGAHIVHADALHADLLQLGPFDVVLGNPPYVRASPSDAPDDVGSGPAGNLAAWITERALACCAPDARLAMVLPISSASTAAWGSFRAAWARACASAHTSHFDAIPSALFADAVQRISLFEGAVEGSGSAPARWYTTRYHRWLRRERDGLLDRVRHVALDPDHDPTPALPKIGSPTERRLLQRIAAHPPLGRWFASDADATDDNVVLYKRRWSYFLLFTDFVPPIWDADGTPREPSELQRIAIDPQLPARVVVAACSSTLFWWWFSALTDNRNVNRSELRAFGFPQLDADQVRELDALGGELMEALHACGEVRECTYRSVGTIRNTYYRQAATRPVIDRIDHALARAYGMTHDELALVLDYEHRFRS